MTVSACREQCLWQDAGTENGLGCVGCDWVPTASAELRPGDWMEQPRRLASAVPGLAHPDAWLFESLGRCLWEFLMHRSFTLVSVRAQLFLAKSWCFLF